MTSKLLATAVAVPLALAAAQRSAPPPPASIQLLAFNDFHGHLEPPTGTNGLVQGTAAGGAEFLASHLARAIAEEPNSLVVAAGDLVGASPLISDLFHDEPAIESLNAMQLSVSAVGNHEFDRGRREIHRLQAGGCHPADGCRDGGGFSGARFQYLAANVVDSGTRQPTFPATIVKTVDGVRIGFIGETVKGTPELVSPAGAEGLTFRDEAATANTYARQLEQQGVSTIVLLIHEGGRQGSTAESADPNACAGFAGAIVPIVRKLRSSIKGTVPKDAVQTALVAKYSCRCRRDLRIATGCTRAQARTSSPDRSRSTGAASPRAIACASWSAIFSRPEATGSPCSMRARATPAATWTSTRWWRTSGTIRPCHPVRGAGSSGAISG